MHLVWTEMFCKNKMQGVSNFDIFGAKNGNYFINFLLLITFYC
jgi:hypothetical protein